MWTFKLEGHGRMITGRPLRIDEQLTEVFNWQMGQNHVLALGHYLDNNQKVLVKLRYQLDPGILDEPPLWSRDDADGNFLNEVEVVRIVADAGYGPQYITHCTQPQGPEFPYANGIVYFIVMEDVPGDILGDIFEDLSISQLQSIRKQLARALSAMSNWGYTLSEQDPDFLRYDAATNNLYLVDFTFMDMYDGQLPQITVDDPYVLAFNIWGALDNAPSLASSVGENTRPVSQNQQSSQRGIGSSGAGAAGKPSKPAGNQPAPLAMRSGNQPSAHKGTEHQPQTEGASGGRGGRRGGRGRGRGRGG